MMDVIREVTLCLSLNVDEKTLQTFFYNVKESVTKIFTVQSDKLERFMVPFGHSNI